MLHAEGPLLSINVGERETNAVDVSDVLESYIGGRGVATRLAHERIPYDVDPYGSENRVLFTTGPMQASKMSFTGRMNCTAVSPLTEGLLSSNAGGFMSRHFAATGNSAVEFVGESDELVVVHVSDQGVEFEAVPNLAGATVPETVEYLDSEHGIGADQTAIIGPAGENRVRFASIMTSEERAFGRGGLGAVLGSKNVKAVTFGGDSAPDIEIPDEQMEIHREAATDDHIMKEQGTVAVMDLANEVSGLPSYYFSEQTFEGVEGINGSAVASKKYKKGTCSSCAFACKLPTKDDERGIETEGPEFEVAMAFGSNAGVDDIVDVMKSNQLCDDYGLDAISAGNVVASYLAAEDEFGNRELIWDLVEKIAHREGVGDTLAEGIDRTHEKLGVENWTVKGMDFAAHEGRVLHGQGLSYAVANRGADHMYATFYSVEYPLVPQDQAVDPEGTLGKADTLIERENLMALNDSGVVCKFSRDYMTPERYETLFGVDFEDLLNVGARTVTLERHFNNQRGFNRDDDRLPYELPDFETALDEYYAARGWTNGGVVPDSRVPP
ncbi:aldehyde:ferredoxin oxidoreductase [Halogeometricum borinquense DSM 11551]|uniref:Aldehyde:ferredoxin oxidoreductase n=1 Tax=Halogeometricum borinquense (strain ATCC 700274 / DSM 11551 / JCM 10706 / KCTC 4070 / PR3) TaxID=469382 RepID=E4NUC1_HALBP|nr:aldehyde ferredoxin oxidoreductase C-terminal domain-containing protein [Halogeometricum borinquense]ADQ68641.1 aldehyde:ferredoxin oxidoreductase [Halogeometricum borinquense DSM 11551]ELY25383.1 aldehyde:ferredoxin oxidoreductase [Halogeometricum borinquense DSM 11551]